MGMMEKVVDAAANFVGPFADNHDNRVATTDVQHIVAKAILHLHAVNTADLATDPNAPYDASMASVVYGLLDLIALLGIIPHLSPGVAFSQRPKPFLRAVLPTSSEISKSTTSSLSGIIRDLMPILKQEGSGIQPLLSQRLLPDIIAALAELSFSPISDHETRSRSSDIYRGVLLDVPTSRLLPILTTFLQQPLPAWLRPTISYELSVIPLRQQGIRHTVEFLSLSYLSKNSNVPQDASGSQSQIPIPLEAIAQAARLLVLPPSGTSQEEWLRKLAPQLLGLLDGNAGKEMSRAAAQIVASGVLSKKKTGAPGTAGWDLFAVPILQAIYPKVMEEPGSEGAFDQRTVVQEPDLKLAMERLSAIASSYSHAGLVRRLIGPVLLPLWALLNYAKARPSLDNQWTLLPQTILTRYMAIACDAKQIDGITSSLFWDGEPQWNFGSGSGGGIEIRRRDANVHDMSRMEDLMSRIGSLDTRVTLLVGLLADANIPDEIAGMLFIQVTKRWLSPSRTAGDLIGDEPETDPLNALIDAKLSEAFATKFREKFARNPHHIIELMGQLIENFVCEHRARVGKLAQSDAPNRTTLRSIVKEGRFDRSKATGTEEGSADEDLISFAISILSTTLSSPAFEQTAPNMTELRSHLPSLLYLSQEHVRAPISPMIHNAASTLHQIISPSPTTVASEKDPLTEARNNYGASYEAALSELTSVEPPMRTRALHIMHKLIRDPMAFAVIDVPSLTQTLLLVSLADSESYVHTAAVPVLVDLASRAPSLVVRILTEAFADVDERNVKSSRGRPTEEMERELVQYLDFRLRTGEVLNNFVLDETFWSDPRNHAATQHFCTEKIVEASLTLSGRRGQRQERLSRRTEVADAKQTLQVEGEVAWDGPIPNLMEPEGEGDDDRVERDAMSKIVQGWENTGLEEDVRVRVSALSVFSTILEHRLDMLRQPVVDAALQTTLMVLTLERSEAKAILRRAGILVVLGLLRGLDKALEDGQDVAVDMSVSQQEQIERVMTWVRDEDGDDLARDHAANVVEGLDTLRVKRLYKVRDAGLRLGPNLELEGGLRGLTVRRASEKDERHKRLIVEELE